MKLNCYDCKKEVEPVITEQIFENGTKHQKATCPFCEKHIKWLGSPENKGTLYFGKYKGQKVDEVAKIDPDYLHWMLSIAKIDKLRKEIEEALIQVGFLKSNV